MTAMMGGAGGIPTRGLARQECLSHLSYRPTRNYTCSVSKSSDDSNGTAARLAYVQRAVKLIGWVWERVKWQITQPRT